jgi:alanine dehydrogenase
MLFSTDNGEPLAIINDGYLQHLRVGALYALGAKYLARRDASVVGILGSGGMAHSHLLAFAAVRKLEKAKVFSPNRAHRESFARDMAQALGFEVLACNSAEEAAKDVDILATCTNSREPTVHARANPACIDPGLARIRPDVYPADVCIGGGPASQVVEGAAIDDSQGFTTYLAGSVAALEQAKGAARPRAAKNKEFSGRLASLAYLITGETPGRMNEQEISASSGIKVGGEDSVKGLQFVTVGSLVYDRAKAAGLGQELPTELFLQDIRDWNEVEPQKQNSEEHPQRRRHEGRATPNLLCPSSTSLSC